MKRAIRSWRFLLVKGWASVMVFVLVLLAIPGAAQSLPAGYYQIAEQPGVVLYRKDYKNGSPDFVLVIDLSTGASIDLLHGKPVDNQGKRQQGMFDGPNPSFAQAPISRYWDRYSESAPDPFCVTNGQFYYMPESPTPLALPLKVDGVLLAEGFGYSQYPEKQLMLALWADRAEILPLTPENLQGTTAPDVIGGLTEEANKKPKSAVGRTFMGIMDRNGDAIHETVLLLTTQTATQPEAARIVRSFGASQVMMLDGGGSTQLVCEGQAYIDTTRAIPQAIGVAAAPEGGPAAPVSAAVPAPLAVEPSMDTAEADIQPTDAQPAVPAPDLPSPTVPPPPPSPEVPTLFPTAPVPTAVTTDPTASPLPSATPSLAPSPAVLPTEPPSDSPYPAPSLSSPSAGPELQGAETTAGNLELELRGDSLPEQVNIADALWLPAIIPPVSIVILFFARRRSRVDFYE